MFDGNENVIPFRYFSVCLFLAAIAVPLAYILYTGHIWEDFFITFKFSRNLAEGRGLVYEDGVRVHGFTSPLGTLIPSLCYLISGKSSYVPAIWVYRLLFCIPAFILSAVYLMKAMSISYACTRIHIFFAAILFLVETKSVIYSVNGMETAFMILFILMAFYYMNKDMRGKWLLSGISWAGIMWTRPDGFLFIAAIVLAWIIFNRKSIDRIFCLAVLKAAAVCTILYLPWFISAWIYYGSPVPNTISAKSVLMADYSTWQYISYSIMKLPYSVIWVFAPVYVQFFGWPSQVIYLGAFLGLVSFLFWILPSGDKISRSASLIFFLLCLYLSIMFFPYPWYYPPVAIFGIIALVRAVPYVIGLLAIKSHATVSISILGAIALFCLYIFIATSYEMRIQQRVIENNHRAKIGEWFKGNMKPGERLYLECTGYVGYFSDAMVYDFPGLVSPQVTKAVREKHLGFATVVPELKPDWVLARPFECLALEQIQYFNDNYQLVKKFEVYDELEKIDYIPGEGYLLYDAAFYVFRKVKK